jgi:hypothetical protein
VRLKIKVPSRRIVQAYQAMFSGHGSQEDARLVREDIETFTGFWDVTTADTPEPETKYAEGQRSVYARISALTRVSDTVIEAVEKARQPKETDL